MHCFGVFLQDFSSFVCPQCSPGLLCTGVPGTGPVFILWNKQLSAAPEISGQAGVGNLGRDFRLEIRTKTEWETQE